MEPESLFRHHSAQSCIFCSVYELRPLDDVLVGLAITMSYSRLPWWSVLRTGNTKSNAQSLSCEHIDVLPAVVCRWGLGQYL
jgi:hypothetical protein